ncbi:KptA family-domain-containing protein [Ganoderma leucocontextum]|nr:KptA family-domain-containing protein [Ganoderma leucocontextum]
MASTEAEKLQERQERRQEKKDRKRQEPRRNVDGGSRGGGGREGGSAKLRGLPKDSHDVRISKTLSWVLRHGSQSEGLAMRPDGYVRVEELLARPKLRELDFAGLQGIVKNDSKSRYNLVLEADPNSGDETWWIRANQGHSMKSVVLDLEPIKSHAGIRSGIAVHGTNKRAWENIQQQGLSKMSRNHIHLAQGVAGSGVISGMRSSSQILIFVDVQKALDAGIKFYLSANGVVLTEGNKKGFLPPEFFSRVETTDRKPLAGWDGPEGVPVTSASAEAAVTTPTDGTMEISSPSIAGYSTEGGGSAQTAIANGVEELEKKVEATTL